MQLNVMQTREEKLQTELKADYFNKQVLKGKQKNDEVQKDAFLHLLVTELKNQNPLDPMKDRDFIAQMAQLTSLEKMEKVRDGMERLISQNSNASLYGLLGRKVTFVNEYGQQVKGAVDAVEFKDNVGYVVVNKNEIHPKQISKVE